MKFIDAIKKFYHKLNIKKLQSANFVQIGEKQIFYNGKHGEKIATCIKNGINQYKDFYNVFLEEYDGICIGNAKNEFKNPLIIEDTIKDSIWKYSDEIGIKSYITALFDECVFSKYTEKHPKFRPYDIKQKYMSSGLEYTYEKKKDEEDFYYLITHKKENVSYLDLLCQLQKWNSLKMLLESNNNREFVEKYTDENLFNILNRTIELYTDRRYDNFFERNIDIISEAVNLTKSDFYVGFKKIWDSATFVFNKMQGGESEEDIKKLLNEYESQQKNDEKNRANNAEIESGRIIHLVNEILNYIDPEQNLSGCFLEKVQSGKIIMFNEHEKDEAIKKLEKIVDTREKAERTVADGPHYNQRYDVCIIPITNRITDVPTIIHEFIHQYHENKGRVHGYSTEIPSVFFEKVTIDYLINNGFEQRADILQDFFNSRRENDACNNTQVINRFVNITKIKRDEGSVTLQNILTDDSAQKMNAIEQLLHKGRNVADTRKEYAKSVIKSFANRSRELNQKIVIYCSYSLGTFFAERYSGDEKVKTKMLKLINNPDYSIQMLIDDIKVQDKKKEQEPDLEIN